MSMVRCVLLGYFLTGWTLLACVPDLSASVLTIGTISEEPAEDTRLFTPMAHYLAKQLAPQGIREGKVVIASSMDEMVTFLKSGRVDFFFDSPLTSLLVNHRAGSKMLLRRWKKGRAEYRSVFFVKKESPIQNLSDLSGKIVAFEEPYSSSGYLLPRTAMMQTGLDLVQVQDTHKAKAPPKGKVGYLFSNDEENTVFWVLMGKVDAGAISMRDLEKNAKGDMDKLRVFYETFFIPRHIVNLRADFPEERKKALVKTLQEMEHNGEGKAMLEDFEKTTRFDPIPSETLAHLQQVIPTILEIMGFQP